MTLQNLLDRLPQNPIVTKELRRRMRGPRAFLLLVAYLVFLSLNISLIYLAFTLSTDEFSNIAERQRSMGKTIFGMVVLMELNLVTLISPALTAGAIAAERERQTFDLLYSTLLKPLALVSGKMTAALSFILLLIIAAMPLQSIAFLVGGVELPEVIIALIILIVSAMAFTAIGLFFSSFIRRTLVATVTSYVTSIVILFFVPFLLFVLSLFVDIMAFPLRNDTVMMIVVDYASYTIGWILVSMNPLAAALATELMILDNRNIFFTTLSIGNGYDFPVIAPWISYSVFFSLFSLVLIGLSVFFVNRIDQ